VSNHRVARIDGYLRARSRRRNGPGLALAVARLGRRPPPAMACRERGRPDYTDAIFQLASWREGSLTGLGISDLAEEGKLSLDDPVARHLPPLPPSARCSHSADLLHHTSGIRDLYDEDGLRKCWPACASGRPDAYMIRAYVDSLLSDGRTRIRRATSSCYRNSGYDLLAH